MEGSKSIVHVPDPWEIMSISRNHYYLHIYYVSRTEQLQVANCHTGHVLEHVSLWLKYQSITLSGYSLQPLGLNKRFLCNEHNFKIFTPYDCINCNNIANIVPVHYTTLIVVARFVIVIIKLLSAISISYCNNMIIIDIN